MSGKNKAINRNLAKIDHHIINKQKGLEFLLKNHDFFLTRSFGDIPDHLISRIEDLSECSLIRERIPSSARIIEMVDKSSKFLKCIFTNPPFIVADSIYSKVKNGLQFQILFGKIENVDINNDLIMKLELDKPKNHFNFEKRINKGTNTNMVISDYGACLMLEEDSGLPDVNNVVVGYDENFIQWCNDLFELKWKESQRFARLRVD